MVSSSSKPSTPSDATPSTPKKEDGKETPVGEHTVWIPCRVDSIQLEEDGSLNIMGLNLKVARDGDPLPLNVDEGDKLELYLSVDDAPGKAPLADGDEIHKDSDLFLLIYKASMEDVATRVKYKVELPEGLKAPEQSGSQDLYVNFTGLAIKFGTLSWDAGGTELTLEFIPVMVASPGGGGTTFEDLIDVSMWFGCNLGAEAADANDQGVVEIELPGSKSVSIVVKDWVPKPPEMEKTGEINDRTGYVDWTITYTHPVDGYIGGRPVGDCGCSAGWYGIC